MSDVTKLVDEIKTCLQGMRSEVSETRGKTEAEIKEIKEKHNSDIDRLESELKAVKAANGRAAAAAAAVDLKKEGRAFLKAAYEGAVTKQNNTLTPSEGGFLVPEILASEILRSEKESSDVMAVANVITISGAGNEFTIPTLVSEASGAWIGELTALPSPQKAGFDETKIGLHKHYAAYYATQELLDDAAYDVGGMLQASLAEQLALQANAAFISGDGNGKPKGVLSYNKVSVAGTAEFGKLNYRNTATAKALSGDDFIRTAHDLKAGYRGRAQWAMNRLTIAEARTLKVDGATGAYQLYDLTQGGIPTICGLPVLDWADVPAFLGSSQQIATDVAILADWARFYTVVRKSIFSIAVNPYSNEPFIRFAGMQRIGGGISDFHAGISLVCKQS